jgi:hypothetical protein
LKKAEMTKEPLKVERPLTEYEKMEKGSPGELTEIVVSLQKELKTEYEKKPSPEKFKEYLTQYREDMRKFKMKLEKSTDEEDYELIAMFLEYTNMLDILTGMYTKSLRGEPADDEIKNMVEYLDEKRAKLYTLINEEIP